MGDVVSSVGKGLGDAWDASSKFVADNGGSAIAHYVGDVSGYNAQQRADSNADTANSRLNEASKMNKDVSGYIDKGQTAVDASGKQINSQLDTNNQSMQTAQNQGAQYDKGAMDSMGANAGDMMKRAQDASSQNAVNQANQAGGQAAAGARAAGLNAGQAAMMASQGTSGTYNQALQQGMGQYNQNAQSFANQGNVKAQVAQGYGGLANQNVGQGQQNVAQQQNQTGQKLQQAGTQASIATGNTGLANQQQSTANQQGQSILSGATSVLGALSDESMKYSMKDLSGSGDTGGKSYQPADWGKFVDTMKSKMTPGGSPSGAMQGFDLSGKGAPASATTATGGPNFAGLASDTTAGASPLAGLAGGAGASAGGAGALMALSDKNAKTDTQPKNMKEVLNSLLANVKPVSYKYKPGVEVAKPEGTPRVGIIAQDLEKTPLKDTVMDTPQGKQLDVGQLTANNTALIIELAGQIRDLQQQLKGTK